MYRRVARNICTSLLLACLAAFGSASAYSRFPAGKCPSQPCGSHSPYLLKPTAPLLDKICFRIEPKECYDNPCCNDLRETLEKIAIKSYSECTKRSIKSVTVDGVRKGGGIEFTDYDGFSELKITSLRLTNATGVGKTICVTLQTPCDTVDKFCRGQSCVYSVYDPFTHLCCPACEFESYYDDDALSPPLPETVDRPRSSALSRVNEYRNMHDVFPVTLSSEVDASAQAWAEHLARIGRLEHSKDTVFGENLAYFSGNIASTVEGVLNASIDAWYGEVVDYDFDKPGFKPETGHFTQLVWRDAARVGFGITDISRPPVFVVMRFDPRGNMMGDFEENVRPPIEYDDEDDSSITPPLSPLPPKELGEDQYSPPPYQQPPPPKADQSPFRPFSPSYSPPPPPPFLPLEPLHSPSPYPSLHPPPPFRPFNPSYSPPPPPPFIPLAPLPSPSPAPYPSLRPPPNLPPSPSPDQKFPLSVRLKIKIPILDYVVLQKKMCFNLERYFNTTDGGCKVVHVSSTGVYFAMNIPVQFREIVQIVQKDTENFTLATGISCSSTIIIEQAGKLTRRYKAVCT